MPRLYCDLFTVAITGDDPLSLPSYGDVGDGDLMLSLKNPPLVLLLLLPPLRGDVGLLLLALDD